MAYGHAARRQRRRGVISLFGSPTILGRDPNAQTGRETGEDRRGFALRDVHPVRHPVIRGGCFLSTPRPATNGAGLCKRTLTLRYDPATVNKSFQIIREVYTNFAPFTFWSGSDVASSPSHSCFLTGPIHEDLTVAIGHVQEIIRFRGKQRLCIEQTLGDVADGTALAARLEAQPLVRFLLRDA